MGNQSNGIRKLSISLLIVFWNIMFSKITLGQKVYSDLIKTVKLYSFGTGDNVALRYTNPAVINLNSGQKLILEFDDLRASHQQFRAKIIHLNPDNQKSNLAEMEYLNGFNEYFLNDYLVSENTKIPYYHYAFEVPLPKISGNYRLEIYENYDEQAAIEYNFSVVEPKIGIDARIKAAVDPQYWRSHQQIDLTLDIAGIQVAFPQNELKIWIKKNQRNDQNILLNNQYLKNAGLNKLSYRYFENQNLFSGGNEFRFIDLSSNIRRGQNIAKIENGRPDTYFTIPQKNRGNKNYVNAYDNDGQYMVLTQDHNDAEIGADYARVIFNFDIPYMGEGNAVGILGAFTHWIPEKLEFNPNTQTYQKEFMLKQGVYDYLFVDMKSETEVIDEQKWEGSFSETNNTYEIMVYHQIPGSRNYSLVGYQIIKVNR